MSGYAGFGPFALLKDVSADETISPWVPMMGRQNLAFYLSSVGTTSSGVVSLEECLPVADPLSPNEPQQYSGTASTITTVDASTFTGGAQVTVHLASSRAYGYVRARVSTAIGGGGTISVGLVAV